MELPSIEHLNLKASPSKIEEWVERFELWCSIRKGGVQKQSALFLNAGGRDLYLLLEILTFPEVPAKLLYESLKSLLLNHLLPTEFQAHERAKFNSMIRAYHMSCRNFILQLNRQASRCNYGDRLEEQMCDRLVAGINNFSLRSKLLGKKDLTFPEARKIYEQHDDLMKATSSEAVTLFQRQKNPPNRPPTVKRAPKPQKISPGNEKRINLCLSCGSHYLSTNCLIVRCSDRYSFSYSSTTWRGLTNSPCFVFADDVKVVGSSGRAYLVSDIERVVEWSNKWNLALNAAKCQLLTKQTDPLVAAGMWGTFEVKRLATRMVEGERGKSYQERLRGLDLFSPERRRIGGDLIEAFKLRRGSPGIPPEELFTDAPYAGTKGHEHKLMKKRSRLGVRSNYFCNRIVNRWNRLPEEEVYLLSIQAFKLALDKGWFKLFPNEEY
ncbi:unnamed protein product [Echinostoma caproni]|uniref:DUF1891 domain-containing protein n=1 Tax=Echinostoma caproni TaxID=27848 RepID=A0A183B5B0_9TREM|nr:unnamed protein product [Echinostoma caproni]